MNVFELLQERLKVIFEEFDNIYISFSGGKDSGVLLNAVIKYIRDHKLNRKIGVFHIDYEAQYQMTTEYVDNTLKDNLDIIEVYRICLPIKAGCSTSMYQNYWRPWEPDKKDIWVRELPADSINIFNHNFDFDLDITDYEFQTKFSVWLHQYKKAKRTACLVGIRTQESLNRWRAVHSEKNYKIYDKYKWTKYIDENVYNAYPIYDWLTDDVWVANAKFNWSYNKLYDLFYQAGVPIAKMRVSSPFHDYATESLKLYRAIEPHTWAKMVGRVNGANFTNIYGGTTAMGWHSIKLPDGYTWEKYMYFLLDTLPNNIKNNYLKKLNTSMKFWTEKGGVLDDDTIKELKKRNIAMNIDNNNVKMKYIDSIDIKNAKAIPTFKRMCICIMKNDHHCKYMGFTFTKNDIIKRKNIMNKYKELL